MSNKPELKITESVRDLAKKVEDQLTIGEGGVVTLEKDFATKLMPETLTTEDIKKVQEYRNDLIAATTLALGEGAIEHFAQHKSENLVSTGFAFGSDSIDIQVARHKQYPAPGGGDPVDVYGATTVKVTTFGASTSRGQLKRVNSFLKEVAEGKLK